MGRHNILTLVIIWPIYRFRKVKEKVVNDINIIARIYGREWIAPAAWSKAILLP